MALKLCLSFAGIIKKAPPNATLWFIPFVLYLYGAFFLISNIPVIQTWPNAFS